MEEHVQITGIHDEDDFTKSEINVAVNNSMKRIGELFKKCKPCELSLNLVVKQHNKTGSSDKKTKYSVHAKMQTPVGMLNAEAHAFGKLISIVQECLTILEREIKKNHDKLVSK